MLWHLINVVLLIPVAAVSKSQQGSNSHWSLHLLLNHSLLKTGQYFFIFIFSQVLMCYNLLKDASYSPIEVLSIVIETQHLQSSQRPVIKCMTKLSFSLQGLPMHGYLEICWAPLGPSLWIHLKEGKIWKKRDDTEPWQIPSPRGRKNPWGRSCWPPPLRRSKEPHLDSSQQP